MNPVFEQSVDLPLPLKMLLRDWRAGELRVLALALTVAVAAITSVAFFADRVGQGLARDAHQLLGADLVMVADQPWPGEVAAQIERAGVQRAEAINFISMASAKEGQLAGVKAVSENYPLRGRLRTAPAPGSPDAAAERTSGRPVSRVSICWPRSSFDCRSSCRALTGSAAPAAYW